MPVIIENRSLKEGYIDCSANPNYPTTTLGHEYEVTVAGKIGGVSGITVQVGDIIKCILTNLGGDQATVGANFVLIEGNRDEATETVLGLVKRASVAETAAETNNTKFISPYLLAQWIGGKTTDALQEGATNKYLTNTNLTSVLGVPTTNGYLLSSTTLGVRTWIAPPATSPLTTKGDIYTYDSVNQRLPVGTNGFVLSADSTATTGLKWITAPNPSQWTTTGSDIYYSTGGVMIGQASVPSAKLHTVDTGTSSPRGIMADQYNNGVNSSQFNLRKARGTFGSPATIIVADVISNINSWAHDGTNFVNTSSIRVTSVGTIGTGRTPSKMEFYTMTDVTTGVLTLALTIDQAQDISFANMTTGSVLFAGTSGKLSQDNSNFYWNSGSHILSINTNADQTGTDSINVYKQIDSFTLNTSDNGFSVSHSRGTASVPTESVAADLIGGYYFYPYNGTAWTENASIRSYVVGATSGNKGADLEFWVKPNAGSLSQVLNLQSVASGINYIALTNNSTGNPPTFTSASVSDTNVGMRFVCLGAGGVSFDTGSSGSSHTFKLNGVTTVSVLASALSVVGRVTVTGNYQSTNASAWGLVDANSNKVLEFPAPVTSAVNYIGLTNAATGANPTFTPTGTDSNIGITFTTKATGALNLLSSSTGFVNIGREANVIYRTSNGGSNINALIAINGTTAGVTAGNMSWGYDITNGYMIFAGNGTNRILRWSYKLTNLVNTAGSESSDLTLTPLNTIDKFIIGGAFSVSTLNGSTTRFVTVDTNGNFQAVHDVISGEVTNATIQALLSNIANWTAKVYTGTAITGVSQTQWYYDATYYYFFTQDNVPVRMALI